MKIELNVFAVKFNQNFRLNRDRKHSGVVIYINGKFMVGGENNIDATDIILNNEMNFVMS